MDENVPPGEYSLSVSSLIVEHQDRDGRGDSISSFRTFIRLRKARPTKMKSRKRSRKEKYPSTCALASVSAPLIRAVFAAKPRIDEKKSVLGPMNRCFYAIRKNRFFLVLHYPPPPSSPGKKWKNRRCFFLPPLQHPSSGACHPLQAEDGLSPQPCGHRTVAPFPHATRALRRRTTSSDLPRNTRTSLRRMRTDRSCTHAGSGGRGCSIW